MRSVLRVALPVASAPHRSFGAVAGDIRVVVQPDPNDGYSLVAPLAEAQQSARSISGRARAIVDHGFGHSRCDRVRHVQIGRLDEVIWS